MRQRFRKLCLALLDRAVRVEIIGQDECPMMMRWQFLNVGFLKAMVHYFPPNVSDRDPHDHPRSFLTFILRGHYFNTEWVKVDLPDQKYMQEIEMIEAGRVVYRPASHAHIVETDDRGCWSLVVMGPATRKWGFLRHERWIPFAHYINIYGGVTRCDTE